MTELPPASDQRPLPLTDGGAKSPAEQSTALLLAGLSAPDINDFAVERVWRRLARPRRARSPALVWALSGAVVALTLVSAIGSLRQWFAPPVELTLASGGVFTSEPAASWQEGEVGHRLVETQRLRTDGSGRALIRIRKVASLLVEQDSDVALERVSKGVFVRLAHGRLTARVSKRPPGEPFIVQTDRYTVTVVGTLFSVEQDREGLTAVSVREGTVEVSNGSDLVARVTAGSRWSSDALAAKGSDSTPDEVRALLEAGLRERPVEELAAQFAALTEHHRRLSPSPSPVTGSSTGSSLPAASQQIPPLASALASDPDTRSPPRSESARVRGPHRESGLAAGPAPTPPVTTSPITPPPLVLARADLPPATRTAPQTIPAPVPSTGAPNTPPPVEGPYARALRLEAEGNYAAAADELAHAAELDPRTAELALYSLGRLAQKQLHDPARALDAFQRCRRRFPAGALAPEVDLSILELTVASHQREVALDESSRFLVAYPNSDRSDEVHLLRGGLLRDEGDCHRALSDFQAVRGQTLAEEALFSTAYCQMRLGDRAAARKTLSTYLARYPTGHHRAEADKALSGEPDKSF